MQEGPKLISWIVLTASIVFAISMTIYHPDDSQSLQQYRSGTVGQTASPSVYIPDHSLYTTTSSDESDEEEDENIFIFQEDEKSKKLTDEEIEELGLFEK